jgi:hypothetical protein
MEFSNLLSGLTGLTGKSFGNGSDGEPARRSEPTAG